MFDSHYHIDESTVSAPGFIASMDAAGVRRAALIAPMCPDLAATPLFRLASPLFRSMVRGGRTAPLARKLYQSWVAREGFADVGGRLYRIKPQPNNDVVRRAVKKYPDRFVGWIFVNPEGPADPIREIERCLKTPGMMGVKAHPYWHGYPVWRLLDTAAYCAKQGLPILIHLGAETGGDFRLLPDRFPDLRVIYAHCGVPFQEEVLGYAMKKPNVYVDLSCTAYVDRKSALCAVNVLGPRRCLFGSDGPYFHNGGDRFDYGPIVAMIRALNLSPEDHEAVCGKNFERILERR